MENVEAQTVQPQAVAQAQAQAQAQVHADEATPKQATKHISCTKIMLILNLISRILTALFLLVALIVLATLTATIALDYGDINFHFQSVIAYRYVMATIVIGLVYTLLQTGFVISQAIRGGKRLFTGQAMLFFDFYADKVVSGLLATGAGAGFGATIDLKDGNDVSSLSGYFDKGAAVASLVLIAFLFNEASQIISSYALPKKNC